MVDQSKGNSETGERTFNIQGSSDQWICTSGLFRWEFKMLESSTFESDGSSDR